MKLPLNGVKVLDFSRIIAGPFCGLLLGDMGADVIKVEGPEGDESRYLGPPFEGEETSYYLAVNRNKRSMILNLNNPESAEVVERLVREADVIIDNFRPGTLSKFGLDYAQTSKINPQIIQCSITGFGKDGPYQNKPGLELIFQGFSGLLSISGEPEGMPMRMGIPTVDMTTGIMAAYSIMTALFRRERTGEGEWIDLSLMDVSLSLGTVANQIYFATGKNPPRLGTASHFTLAQVFRVADGYITLTLQADKYWDKFCHAIKCPDLLEDARFKDNQERVRHRQELTEVLNSVFRQRPSSEWLDILEHAGIPCGPVNTYEQVFQDPQVQHRKMETEVSHPKLGSIRLTGSPIKLFHGETCIQRYPPLLGEHTEEIMMELGYDVQKIKALEKKGVYVL